ncbi:MAG TPA: phosphomannomutase/phosphoglucomutase [Nitrospiraceae bacterium]|nr:phosphomannomutase/phosphoglucomutase [Nitrospiraceae bacterium]
MALFREYDIRGIVGEELTEDMAERIGRAYGSLAVRAGAKAVAVGRDGRTSAMQMRKALLKGLLGCGLDVVDIGVCPTPLLYYALFTLPVGGGVMITASHNPPQYNGFKLCLGKDSMHGEAIQALKADIDKGQFEAGRGTVSEHPIIPDYMAFIKKSFAHVTAGALRVVVDCGNGMGGLVGPAALRLLGCHVTGMYEDVDGRFPNHDPDPTVTENLQDLIKKVRETKANVGIAYDGDADRIGAVDEHGDILWGDRLLVLYARDILAEKPGSTVISEVKASQCLYDDIQRRGGRPIMWKTGHSLIKAKMKAERAALAGEMSGHMFFADRYFGYDDAVYASCRLIEILAKAGRPLSTLLADLPATSVTPEIRVDCPDAAKFDLVKKIQTRFMALAKSGHPAPGLKIREVITIDGTRVIFEDGWGLIRASNTQPALVLRFEASSPDRLTAIRGMIEAELADTRRSLAI